MEEESLFRSECQINIHSDEKWIPLCDELCYIELLIRPADKRARFVVIQPSNNVVHLNSELLGSSPIQILSKTFVHFLSPISGSYGFNFLEKEEVNKLSSAIQQLLLKVQFMPQQPPEQNSSYIQPQFNGISSSQFPSSHEQLMPNNTVSNQDQITLLRQEIAMLKQSIAEIVRSEVQKAKEETIQQILSQLNR